MSLNYAIFIEKEHIGKLFRPPTKFVHHCNTIEGGPSSGGSVIQTL